MQPVFTKIIALRNLLTARHWCYLEICVHEKFVYMLSVHEVIGLNYGSNKQLLLFVICVVLVASCQWWTSVDSVLGCLLHSKR